MINRHIYMLLSFIIILIGIVYIIESDKTTNINLVKESVFGRSNLLSYQQDVQQSQKRTAITIIGDSWVQGGSQMMGDRLPIPLRNTLVKSMEMEGWGLSDLQTIITLRAP